MVDAVQAGVEHGWDGGEAPGIGESASHHGGMEAEEGGGDHAGADLAHRRRPPGEVAHPEALQTDVLECLTALGGEVGDGVVGLEQAPQAPGDRRLPLHYSGGTWQAMPWAS